jgi:hypothetical protein
MILVGRAADPVRTGTAAEGIQLVQTLQNPHRRIITTRKAGVRPNGSDPGGVWK